MAKERLVEEFCRLVKEYGEAKDSTKEEAWNLIADFAIENSLKISLALDKQFPAKKLPPSSEAIHGF